VQAPSTYSYRETTILSALYTFAGDYSIGGSCRHPKVLCSFVSRWVDEAGGGMINWDKT
jgi:hypothetical protein